MIVYALQGLLALAVVALAIAWFRFYRSGGAAPRTGMAAVLIGAVTNFFDTLGIGSFAPTTAVTKFFRLSADENIPGTLNVGHSIPTIAQALIFIAIVSVDVTLLVCCLSAAVMGAVLGAGVVRRMPVRAIRLGMGGALLVAAALFTIRNLGLTPGGGAALALSGTAFVVAVALHFVFGALMTLGIGLYAPALITLSMLGMDPRAAFPIMMGACAFLMPTASLRFIKARRFDPALALGLTVGGVPAVLVAALIVKEMPLDLLRWLVAAVVLIAAIMMLASGLKSSGDTNAAKVTVS